VSAEEVFKELEYATGISRQELESRVVVEPDAYAATADAHALAVVTEWDCFRELDFRRIYAMMNKPAFAFDGRNILPRDRMRAIGFEVHAIGKPAPEPGVQVRYVAEQVERELLETAPLAS
jgi:UDPglucose 6-dehydrogenase